MKSKEKFLKFCTSDKYIIIQSYCKIWGSNNLYVFREDQVEEKNETDSGLYSQTISSSLFYPSEPTRMF